MGVAARSRADKSSPGAMASPIVSNVLITAGIVTILALAYALFLETFIGNMPGIVKRLTVSYYTRCLIFEGAKDLGIEASGPFDPDLFLPISGDTAQIVLWLITLGLWLAGLVVFSLREYAK